MGRLGFNLVRQKDASKNVESGLQADQQQQNNEQNESNENVEIGELIMTIDKANRTIKNYRWLSMILIAVIITLCGYIFVTQTKFHSTQAVVDELNKIREECSNKLRQEHEQYIEERIAHSDKFGMDQQMERDIKEQKARESLTALEESFNTLQGEHEDLTDRCQKKEHSLQDEIQKLQSEREELLNKIESSNQKLELQKSESQKLLTTTTARPRTFGSSQLKKINDLIKNIESVGRLVGNVFREGI